MSDGLTMRLATSDDAHLPAFDFTKLSAVNTCPRYGIIRYSLHKATGYAGRAMALEAGTAMHQCFAAIRLWQLAEVQELPLLALHHGKRIFGADRWAAIRDAMKAHHGDADMALRACALETLSTSGFTDDDSDKRRTYSNLETSLLYYTQRWDHARYPVWVRDEDDPACDVGIEIPFDIVIEALNEQGSAWDKFRYTGRIDGIHVDRSGELLVAENKTTSRITAAWRMAFNTSHQVTGYCAAASLFTDQLVQRAMILGISTPLPRELSNGLAVEPVSRPVHMHVQWIDWLLHTVRTHNQHVDAPLLAPMYTHSCNRYFSACSLIPLCASDPQEQAAMLDEMRTDEWSPLAEQA